MTEYIVFHKNNDRFFEAETPELDAGIQWDNYTLICRVELDGGLENVWEACNTKPWDTQPWYEADNIRLALDLEGARSLSVGDLVYNCTENELYEVAGFGFKKVSPGLEVGA